MPFHLLLLAGVLLLSACVTVPSQVSSAAASTCAAQAAMAPSDTRLQRAIDEARLQHRLFGGQTVERNGGLFRAGHHEAGWSRAPGESTPAWQRVAAFWQVLSDAEPPALITSVGRVSRSEATAWLEPAGAEESRAEVAIREALLRASIMDTPWSAAFISYLMQTAGFSQVEFAYSATHADYVQAAFAASEAEAQGLQAPHAWRACDVASTPPRPGDLLCATRAATARITHFESLRAALAQRARGQPFPMHCDLVVHAGQGSDDGLDIIGGNVLHSVTLSRLALDSGRVLRGDYFADAAAGEGCGPGAAPCRGHLSRRSWVVLLQFRR